MATWIFQGNPELYDLIRYFKEEKIVRWDVNQSHFEYMIAPGDIVYIWRSNGSSGELFGGVIAKGTVVNNPLIMPPHRPDLWFVKPQNYLVHDLRVDIEIEEYRSKKLDGMLRAADLKIDPNFKNARIIKWHQETNYLLDCDTAKYLEELWNKARK